MTVFFATLAALTALLPPPPVAHRPLTSRTPVRLAAAVSSGAKVPEDGYTSMVGGQLISPEGVALSGYRLELRSSVTGATVESAFAGAHGEFTFPGLPAAEYQIFVTMPQGPNFVAPSPSTLTVLPGQPFRWEKVISPAGALITGRILDPDTGVPLAGVPVGVGRAGSDVVGFHERTDRHGRFQLRTRAGDWKLFVKRSSDPQKPYLAESLELPLLLHLQDGGDYQLGDLISPAPQRE